MILAAVLGVILVPGFSLAQAKPQVKTETERINYSIGYQIGGDFQRQGWKLNPDLLLQGIKDAIGHADPLLSPEQMSATLVDMKKKLVADEQVASKQADAAFLKENGAKEGVVVLPSGVQYKVMKEGSGKKPTPKDEVTIRYRVSRADGQGVAGVYPDSKEKAYPMMKVLPGLREALQLMKEGSIWQIVLPPGPPMGSQGEALERAGVLVYLVELISVKAGK